MSRFPKDETTVAQPVYPYGGGHSGDDSKSEHKRLTLTLLTSLYKLLARVSRSAPLFVAPDTVGTHTTRTLTFPFHTFWLNCFLKQTKGETAVHIIAVYVNGKEILERCKLDDRSKLAYKTGKFLIKTLRNILSVNPTITLPRQETGER